MEVRMLVILMIWLVHAGNSTDIFKDMSDGESIQNPTLEHLPAESPAPESKLPVHEPNLEGVDLEESINLPDPVEINHTPRNIKKWLDHDYVREPVKIKRTPRNLRRWLDHDYLREPDEEIDPTPENNRWWLKERTYVHEPVQETFSEEDVARWLAEWDQAQTTGEASYGFDNGPRGSDVEPSSQEDHVASE